MGVKLGRWTLSKDIAKRLAAFERKVLRRMFGEIKMNENWRKRYDKELMVRFGDGLDILSFVGMGRMDWIGHVNRVDSKSKVSQVFNNNSSGKSTKGTTKSKWWNCVQTGIIKCKIRNWQEESKTRADWGKTIKETKVRFGL